MISSKGSWEEWLPLLEFSHDNSYKESMLHSRLCTDGNVELRWSRSNPVKEGSKVLTLSGSQEESTNHSATYEGNTVLLKELCQQNKKTAWVWSGWLCLPQCYPNEEVSTLQSQKQASIEVHRTLSSARMERPHVLQDTVAQRDELKLPRIPCVIVKEVFESTWREDWTSKCKDRGWPWV